MSGIYHKWPEGLNSCFSCGVLSGKASYASRGLCTRCYDRHRRHGTLKDFEFLSARWKISAGNPTLRAVRKIGVKTISFLVGESVSTIQAWCSNGTPENMNDVMNEALSIVESKNPEHRALLFSDDIV